MCDVYSPGRARATPRSFGRLALALLLPLTLFVLGTSAARGAQYFVSPYGNDNNSGLSWPQAWRTLKYAGEQAEAGDEVVIRKSPKPYGYLQIRNSGKPGKPITFRGENPADPPVISGGRLITAWTGPDEYGVWKAANQSKTVRMMENDTPILPASSPQCRDGRWHWSEDRTLYYKPSSGTPDDYELWAAGGGGILIGNRSWIVIQNIHTWFALGAGVSIKGGHHNIVRGFQAKWHWQGVHISGGAHNNLVENCVVQGNREGIYIMRKSSNNVIRNCRAHYNGNAPQWSNGDRAGIAIGEKGPNVGNTVEDCDIAFNGSPNSDPALIAYAAPQTVLARNHVHNNFGSGIFVTIGSHDSSVISNVVERNGQPAVQSGHKNIAGLSVRSSRGVLVRDNRVVNNYVSEDSPWPGKGLGPRGGLDLRGLPGQDMTNIVFRNNEVFGTRNGPDVYISSAPNTLGLVIEPMTQAPSWLKAKRATSTRPEAPDVTPQ